jgi:hypothetical protein
LSFKVIRPRGSRGRDSQLTHAFGNITPPMNKLRTTVLVLLLALAGCYNAPENNDSIGRAFTNRTSDVQVQGDGTVTRILSDDITGARHQRFIVRLASGQTVMISHNIDLAPRLEELREGDAVAFNGEYVWNAEGGLVHWTHHDPAGRHVAGWLKYNGRTYQ